jgi:hypothetical protein
LNEAGTKLFNLAIITKCYKEIFESPTEVSESLIEVFESLTVGIKQP